MNRGLEEPPSRILRTPSMNSSHRFVGGRLCAFLACIVFLILAPFASAQAHFNGAKAFDYAREFAAIGPRWPSSPGHAKAEAYLRAHFQKDHLEEDAFTADTPVGAFPLRNFIVRFQGKKPGV